MDDQSTWVFVFSHSFEGVALRPPNTICERQVLEDLRAAWSEEAKKHEVSLPALGTLPHGDMISLDLGGIAHMDRKVYTLQISDRFGVDIPATDVGSYLSILKRLRDKNMPESIGKGLYYTLPSMRGGVLLSLDQVEHLVPALVAISIEASAIASVENHQFNQDITDITNNGRDKNSIFVLAAKRPTGEFGEA